VCNLELSADSRCRLLGSPERGAFLRVEIPPCGCLEPDRSDPPNCYCGVEDLLRVIRKRYSLAVLSLIQNRGRARYRDVAEALEQASTSTLAETLRALESARLIARHGGAGHSEYSVTESGAKLVRRLRPLLEAVRLDIPADSAP